MVLLAVWDWLPLRPLAYILGHTLNNFHQTFMDYGSKNDTDYGSKKDTDYRSKNNTDHQSINNPYYGSLIKNDTNHGSGKMIRIIHLFLLIIVVEYLGSPDSRK